MLPCAGRWGTRGCLPWEGWVGPLPVSQVEPWGCSQPEARSGTGAEGAPPRVLGVPAPQSSELVDSTACRADIVHQDMLMDFHRFWCIFVRFDYLHAVITLRR